MSLSQPSEQSGFYEKFWVDEDYTFAYAFDSAVRDRFPAIQKVWGQLLFPKRVLDYGCGNGVLSYWMAAHGFGQSLTGIDISQMGIANAQQRFSGANLTFQTFEPEKDLSYLGSFDAVVSSHVLEHIHQPELAVAKILPLSDWFLLEVPLENCIAQSIIWKLKGQPREENELGHVNFWDKTEFRDFLNQCGLVIVRDYQYASAPFSPFNSKLKRIIEKFLLNLLGVELYAKLMATHYIVLACRHPSWQAKI